MRRRKCWPALIAFCLLISSPSALHADMFVRLQEENLALGAHSIIIGKVSSVVPQWYPDQRTIWTTVTIDVEKTLKGSVPNPVAVMVHAGTAFTDANGMFPKPGPLTLLDTAQASFKPGEKVFVYLSPLTEGPLAGRLQVYEWLQGKLTITQEAGTGKEVVSEAEQLPNMTFFQVADNGRLSPVERNRLVDVPLASYVEKVESILKAHDYQVIPQHYSVARNPGKLMQIRPPEGAEKLGAEIEKAKALENKATDPKAIQSVPPAR
jgi:hypothetical protein